MAPSGAMGKRRRSSDSGVKFEDSDGGSSVGLFVSERKVDYDSNASDVGSGEDDKDDIGYSEKLENLPHFAAYDPGVQNIKHRLLRIATNAHKILTEDTCDTPEVDKLRDKAKQVLTVPDGERKTIGLVGNAGQGQTPTSPL